MLKPHGRRALVSSSGIGESDEKVRKPGTCNFTFESCAEVTRKLSREQRLERI